MLKNMYNLHMKALTQAIKANFFNTESASNYFARNVIYKQVRDDIKSIGPWYVADLTLYDSKYVTGDYQYGIGYSPNIKVATQECDNVDQSIERLSYMLLCRLNLLVLSALAGESVMGLGFKIDTDWGMSPDLKQELEYNADFDLIEAIKEYLANAKNCNFDTIVISNKVSRELSKRLGDSDIFSERIKSIADNLQLNVFVYDEKYHNEDGTMSRYLPDNKILFVNWNKFSNGESFLLSISKPIESMFFDDDSDECGPTAYATAKDIENEEPVNLTLWTALAGFPVRTDPKCSGCITLNNFKVYIIT